MTEEWCVEFGFEDDCSADIGLLSDITSYKHMWISEIHSYGSSLNIRVESASIHAEYNIKRLAEQYSHLVTSKPKKVSYE